LLGPRVGLDEVEAAAARRLGGPPALWLEPSFPVAAYARALTGHGRLAQEVAVMAADASAGAVSRVGGDVIAALARAHISAGDRHSAERGCGLGWKEAGGRMSKACSKR
jgi:hypothetical protein